MKSEAAGRADFSGIRYAQCWEDADILLEALNIRPGHTCLSIASAGDNALAMLSKGPERVIAIDLSPAQLACVELRVAAYRELSHAELLQLIGSRPCADRRALYNRCRPALGEEARRYWDAHGDDVDRGIGGAGKFEGYFKLFRERVIPFIHGRSVVEELLTGGDAAERERFYEERWNTWRWKLLFRLFFSRTVMGRLGRDPSFFTYVEGSVADRILSRTRHALTALNPADNPYIQWILCGEHRTALPCALRAENFETIRNNLDRLEWRNQSLESLLDEAGEKAFDAYNLSDVFEYMSEENYHALLRALARSGRPGARLAYWNMLAPRRRPESMAEMLRPLDELAQRLHLADKAFFYSAFVVEEVAG
jgi:S-adenosylmethionine-diacylglycerol 3-amino-3-carboxypropyl transferase